MEKAKRWATRETSITKSRKGDGSFSPAEVGTVMQIKVEQWEVQKGSKRCKDKVSSTGGDGEE